MRKITKLEYQKKNKNRVNIYLDEEYAFAVDINILLKHSLKKDMLLHSEEIEDILKSEEKFSVYNYGVYILSRSAKSEKELRLKMINKGFEPKLIDNAINELKEKKYLDDEKYCEMFINDKINIYKYGMRKIKEMLYFKGVDRRIIAEKTKNISVEDEVGRASLLAEKKNVTITEENILKRKTKLFNYLTGKGFEYEVVKKAVSKILNSEIED